MFCILHFRLDTIRFVFTVTVQSTSGPGSDSLSFKLLQPVCKYWQVCVKIQSKSKLTMPHVSEHSIASAGSLLRLESDLGGSSAPPRSLSFQKVDPTCHFISPQTHSVLISSLRICLRMITKLTSQSWPANDGGQA